MSKSPKQLSCAQRLIMRNMLGHRPPAGTVPHAAIVLRTAGGELLRSAQARGPASQPAGWLAVAPLTRHSQRGAPAHRLGLELVIVPRDEPAPPHLEQGREECGEGEPPSKAHSRVPRLPPTTAWLSWLTLGYHRSRSLRASAYVCVASREIQSSWPSPNSSTAALVVFCTGAVRKQNA